jgi:hypothetical protein
MATDTSFGRWLSLRRHRLDLTQDELAWSINGSVVTIRKLEADERRLSEQVASGWQIAWRSPRPTDLPSWRLPDLVPLLNRQRGQRWLPIPPRRMLSQRTNLACRSPLIRYAQHLATVHSQLLELPVRLLTLIGSPGIGKMRLAIAVASEPQDAFPGGVPVVAHAPIVYLKREPLRVLCAFVSNHVVRGRYAQALARYLRDSGHALHRNIRTG